MLFLAFKPQEACSFLWAVPAEAAFVAQLLFFKNIAVIGGLLVLASSGAGKFSIDGFKEAQ